MLKYLSVYHKSNYKYSNVIASGMFPLYHAALIKINVSLCFGWWETIYQWWWMYLWSLCTWLNPCAFTWNVFCSQLHFLLLAAIQVQKLCLSSKSVAAISSIVMVITSNVKCYCCAPTLCTALTPNFKGSPSINTIARTREWLHCFGQQCVID